MRNLSLNFFEFKDILYVVLKIIFTYLWTDSIIQLGILSCLGTIPFLLKKRMKGCDAYEKDRKRIMFYHKASSPCDYHLVNKNSTNNELTPKSWTVYK